MTEGSPMRSPAGSRPTPRSSAGLLLSALVLVAGCSAPPPPPPSVALHYLGHSSFILTFDDTLTVLTDYGESNAYGLDSPVFSLGGLAPDVLTLSHEHADHAGGALPPGLQPRILSGAEILRDSSSSDSEAEGLVFHLDDLTVTAIPTREGSVTGVPDNTSFLFEYRGLRILHLGDCQGLMEALGQGPERDGQRAGEMQPDEDAPQLHPPRQPREAVARIIQARYSGHFHLVLIPIGFTSDILAPAADFATLLDADVIVPMHFWSPADRDDFVALMDGKEGERGQRYLGALTEGASLTLPLLTPEGPAVQVLGLSPSPWRG